MNWIDQLNRSIEYIESNLDKTIDIPAISRIAGCSPYHYQRMFSLIAEITLGEYIRKRRLTMAAYELQNSKVSVIETALKYGYDSPTAFTRAFSKFHGVTPRQAKKAGVFLKTYPKISFEISVNGREELKYRIEKKQGFRFVGIKETVYNDGIYNFIRVPKMWEEAREKGRIEDIFKLSDGKLWGVMGALANYTQDTVDYYIVATSDEAVPEDMAELLIWRLKNMELSKAILTRRSVRNFRKGNIPDDKIRELIKAAVYAPSAGNCQPWHFYVVKDPRVRKRVYEEACRLDFLTEAPVLIIVCIDQNERADRYGERGKTLYNIQNTAAAVQNMLLSATDMGLGSCWCGDFDEPGLQKIFQMDSGRIPVAIVAVGYAGFEPSAPKRKPVDEVADFIGEWEVCGEEETPETRKIVHCDMGGTVFQDVNLHGMEISDANLAEGKIFDCNLSNLEIYDCRLDGMKVNGIDINSLL